MKLASSSSNCILESQKNDYTTTILFSLMHDPSLHKYKCDTIWNACYSVPKPQQLYTSSQQLRAYINTILHVPDMCICCHQCSIGKAMNQPNRSSRGCQYIHIVGIHSNINEGRYSNKHKKSSGQELSHASANKVQIKCLLTIPWGLFVGKCIGLALEEGGGLLSVGQHFYNPLEVMTLFLSAVRSGSK